MLSAVDRILAGEFNKENRFLDFSTPRIELSVHSGEVSEGSFTIYGPKNQLTEGRVSSSRLRMKCLTENFTGYEEEISYQFDAADLEEGECIRGEFSIIHPYKSSDNNPNHIIQKSVTFYKYYYSIIIIFYFK